MALNDTLLKWGGFALVTIAMFVLSIGIVATPQGMVMRYWARYCLFIERKLRSMFIFTPGRTIAIGQLVGVFAVLVLADRHRAADVGPVAARRDRRPALLHRAPTQEASES